MADVVALLRLAEWLVGLLLVAWTVVFPLATLLSLAFTLSLAGLLLWHAAPVGADRRLARAIAA